MIFENIDLLKIVEERDMIKEKLIALKGLEAELQMLEDLERLRIWYLNEKDRCEKGFEEVLDGKGTGRMKYPYRTDSNQRNYDWLKNYPYLALQKGFGGSQRFLAMNENPEMLEAESNIQMRSLKVSSLKRLREFFLKFVKDSEKGLLPTVK